MIVAETFVDTLESIVGKKYVIADTEQILSYADNVISNQRQIPTAVVLPGSTEEISKLMKCCNAWNIQVAVRGGGTGVAGGISPDASGIIISLSRLNKIIEINKIDRLVTAEAGVVTETLQQALLEEGLSFPQNISSANSSFIGGNVSVSSGSPKSLKYGTTKNHVINLEVVLPNGQIIWTGKNVSKNATGYNLTQLIVGSEGTLAVITKVVLEVTDPSEELLALIPFSDIDQLMEGVQKLLTSGINASSIEFVDQKGYEITSNFLGNPNGFDDDVKGLLWVELEGKDQEVLLSEMETVTKVIEPFTPNEVLIAQSSHDVERLWSLRKNIGNAAINYGPFIDLDMVVPRSKIRELYYGLKEISERLEFEYTLLGHIGNGNFHINLFDGTPKENASELDEVVTDIFQLTADLGGTISGEHGIGQVHRKHLHIALSKEQIRLMEEIKKVFDPNGILNSNVLI